MQELLATFFLISNLFFSLIISLWRTQKKAAAKELRSPLEDLPNQFNLPHADDVRDRPDIEPFRSFRIH